MTPFILASTASSIILPIVLVLAVVAMLVLPAITQKKQAKQFNEMISNMKPGDQVATHSGIVGKILKINQKEYGTTVFLETGDKKTKSVMEINIAAVAAVLRPNMNVPKTEEKPSEQSDQTSTVEEKTEEVAAQPVQVEKQVAEKTKAKASNKAKTKK